jgi:hypothetical protein
VKRVEPGDGVLAEDVTHQGHITRVVDRQRGSSVIGPWTDVASQGRKPGCQGCYGPDRWTSQRGMRAGGRISCAAVSGVLAWPPRWVTGPSHHGIAREAAAPGLGDAQQRLLGDLPEEIPLVILTAWMVDDGERRKGA